MPPQIIGQDHFLQACDVTDPAAVENFATAVIGRFGSPDLLLNNAATINPNKPLSEVSAEEFARVIAVNLKGVHRHDASHRCSWRKVNS